ncbi:hypothetical protein EYF80_003740 [Liparis tanakae]|uniref:Uncharacterized protein n=1 Tax=Liparis tanakae TaxID=230148 RepID=A0A4Z2J6T1_9TELE|nr:hypothetical protein EYF80_003740 [Liparis tanakae]
MAKNINIKMSTMIVIVSEADWRRTRSYNAAVPRAQEIGRDRNHSEGARVIATLRPGDYIPSIIEAGDDSSEVQEPTMKSEGKRDLSRRVDRRRDTEWNGVMI